jgi:nitrogen fixation protein FixH
MNTHLSGKHVLLMLAAFFGVILAVNIDLVIKAETSFSGEDEHNAYLQGVDFNNTLARRAEQARLGLQVHILATRGAAEAVIISVAVKLPDGRTPSGLNLEGRLRHPSDARMDHELKFRPDGDGGFVANVADVAPSAWNIEVRSTEKSASPFEADKRIWLR